MDRDPKRPQLTVEEAKARLRRAAEVAEPPTLVRHMARARPVAVLAGSVALGVALGASPLLRRLALRAVVVAAARPGPLRELAQRVRGGRGGPRGPRREAIADARGEPPIGPFDDPMG